VRPGRGAPVGQHQGPLFARVICMGCLAMEIGSAVTAHAEPHSGPVGVGVPILTTFVAVDTVIGVKRQSGLRDDFWLFQSLA
jgi:hypothetical protein